MCSRWDTNNTMHRTGAVALVSRGTGANDQACSALRGECVKNLIVKSEEYRGSIVFLVDDVFTLFVPHQSPTFGQS